VFKKSNHIERYTLKVRVGDIHQQMDILCVVIVLGSVWGCLEQVCGKLRGLFLRYLTYSDEVKALELVTNSSRRHFTSHISARSQAISRDISDLELALGKVFRGLLRFVLTTSCH